MTKSDLGKKRFKLTYNFRELKYIIAGASWQQAARAGSSESKLEKGYTFISQSPLLVIYFQLDLPITFVNSVTSCETNVQLLECTEEHLWFKPPHCKIRKCLLLANFHDSTIGDHGFHIFTGEIVEVGANSTTKLWCIYKYFFTREEFTVLIALLSISVSGKRTGILICIEIPSL